MSREIFFLFFYVFFANGYDHFLPVVTFSHFQPTAQAIKQIKQLNQENNSKSQIPTKKQWRTYGLKSSVNIS
jgi:hypothetical protein